MGIKIVDKVPICKLSLHCIFQWNIIQFGFQNDHYINFITTKEVLHLTMLQRKIEASDIPRGYNYSLGREGPSPTWMLDFWSFPFFESNCLSSVLCVCWIWAFFPFFWGLVFYQNKPLFIRVSKFVLHCSCNFLRDLVWILNVSWSGWLILVFLFFYWGRWSIGLWDGC